MAEPRKCIQLTTAQKRALAEETTQVAAADTERRHKERHEKTARRRAQGLASEA